jgi:hypothetical protein
MQYPLRIGTCGWSYQTWEGTFYDADLPPEWQLSWYANHLRSVLIPADGLHQMSLGRVRSWVEDTDPEFRFIATIDPIQFPPDCREAMLPDLEVLVAAFGEQLDALVIDVGDTLSASQHFLEKLRLTFPDLPVCLEGLPADELPHGFGGCFNGEEDFLSANSPYTIVHHSEGDLVTVRTIIETMQRSSIEAGALIFFDPDRAFDHAGQARTVADLLEA